METANKETAKKMPAMAEQQSLVLIDGECNLCNGLVQFIIKRDKAGKFQYAPLQSPVGQRILQAAGMKLTDFDTFLLLENDCLYTKSGAALRIMRKLDGAWPLLYGLIIIPSTLRNGIYDRVARNRYRWFGRRDSCLLPTEDVKRRFVSE